jgi:hypothetical protein
MARRPEANVPVAFCREASTSEPNTDEFWEGTDDDCAASIWYRLERLPLLVLLTAVTIGDARAMSTCPECRRVQHRQSPRRASLEFVRHLSSAPSRVERRTIQILVLTMASRTPRPIRSEREHAEQSTCDR